MIIGEFEKQPWERLDYDVSYEPWLTPGDNLDVLAASVLPTGLTVDTPVNNDPVVKVWISGGTDGVKYKVTLQATTDDARKKEVEFNIKVKDH